MVTAAHARGGADQVEPSVGRRAWVSLALAAAGAIVIAFNVTATNIAFPEISRDFDDVSQATLSWAISGYSIGLAGFLLVGGRVADRTGRRKVFLAGCAALAVASVLTAAAPTAPLFLAMRFFQAVGGAFALPASLAMVLPGFPTSHRGRVVSIWSASSSIGAALAPSLSALVVDAVHWRGVYLLGVPVLGVVLVVGRRVLPESRAPSVAGSLDGLGVAIGTLAVAATVFTVSQGSALGWSSPWVVGGLVVALVLIPGFVWRCSVHPEPLLDLAVFRRRAVWSANLANLLLSMAGMSIWVVWPLFLSSQWGYSALRSGLAITAGPANASLWSILAGRIVDRHGPRLLVSFGCLFPVAATCWFTLRLGSEPAYVSEFLPGILLFSTGFGLTFSPLNAAALAGVPERVFGQVNAAFNAGRYVGGAVGTAAVVALLGERSAMTRDAFDRAYLFLAACTAAGAAVVWLTYPRGRREAAAADGVDVERRPRTG